MQDINAIRPPVMTGFDPLVIKVALMVLAGLLLLVLVFFLIKKHLKKRKQPGDLKYLPAPLAPYDAAIRELERLAQSEILDSRLFYFSLTAVLRQYIGGSFNINAIEMTSQEFVRSMNRLDIGTHIKREISDFFALSDPIKYAGTVPAAEQVKKDLLSIKEMIRQIEKDLVIKKDEFKEKESAYKKDLSPNKDEARAKTREVR